MNFANNLQYLRKKHGMTQEDLADYLGVSRQSVSKWEIGAAYPETDKLIILCDKFNVTLDALVRTDLTGSGGNLPNADDYSQLHNNGNESLNGEHREQVKIDTDTVYPDSWGYDRHINIFSKFISIGVVLVMLGLAIGMLVQGVVGLSTGMQDQEKIFIPIFLIGFVAIAVFFFAYGGIKHAQFMQDNGDVKNVYAKEEKHAFNKKFAIAIAVLVPIIILSVIALVVGGYLIKRFAPTNKQDSYYFICMAIFFLIVAFDVGGFCYFGMQKAKYDMTIVVGHRESDKLSSVDGVCGIIMMLCTASYLIFGFTLNLWHPLWIVFPIGGIICGIINVIAKIDKNEK